MTESTDELHLLLAEKDAEIDRLRRDQERLEEELTVLRRSTRLRLSDAHGNTCFGSDGQPGECTLLDVHLPGCPDSPLAERAPGEVIPHE